MADNNDPNSFACRRRAARMAPLMPFRDRPLRVVDLGGSAHFWMNQPVPFHRTWQITLLNLVPQLTDEFKSVVRDVTELDAAEIKRDYDLIFSNSLIEHLGTWQNKRKMCDGIRATGLPYFVQTPHYWFPVEPHWLIPGFQFLPRPVQVALLARRSETFRTSGVEREKVRQWIDDIDLLTVNEMRELLPGSSILRERVLGLTKSFVAYNVEALRAENSGGRGYLKSSTASSQAPPEASTLRK